MRRGQQWASEVLYVVAESVPWFVVIAVLTTATERGFLAQVADRLATSIAAGEFASVGPPLQVLAETRAAADSVIVGPSLPIVVLAGLGAFFLMRWLGRSGITGGFGAAVLLLVSVVALNALLHLALAGDLRVWDNSGLARFIDDPGSHFPERLDVRAFAASPNIGRPHGTALSLAFFGMVLLWVRFLIGGRSAVTFERVLRSFSIGFVVMLGALALARVLDVGSLAVYAIPYFVLGLLALAVAHSARHVSTEEDGRTAPWAISVSATLLTLLISALVLGLLAFLDAGRAAVMIAGGIGWVIGWVLVIILTPIFWVLETIIRLLLPEGLQDMFQNFGEGGFDPNREPLGEQSEEGLNVPAWLIDGLKIIALSTLTYLSFRFARMILQRRMGDGDAGYDEARSRGQEATGIGGLLKNLIPRGGRRGGGGDWTRRHPSYRLFARSVLDAQERGFRRRPGETPLEFAATGGRVLEAPVFEPIAEVFDRVRYGKHDASREEVASLHQELVMWEAAHPATEELRERIAGVRPLDDAERIALNIEIAKRAARGDPNARRMDLTGLP